MVTHKGRAETPQSCEGSSQELSADDMEVRVHRAGTKIRVIVINRLAGAASLRATKDVAVSPNLTERKIT